MSSRMLRSKIRSKIFDLPFPSRHGKERQKSERDDSLRSCPIPLVPEMHLLRRPFHPSPPPLTLAWTPPHQLFFTQDYYFTI
uniref:Uncharacterized protein n=1 Tax=Raphanus sativus TaxID=3726 RepID=A0A650GBK8_RAPSA|nr:hypothetical protein [Raphanus sativus]